MQQEPEPSAPFTEYTYSGFQRLVVFTGAAFVLLFAGHQSLVAASKGAWIGATLLACTAGFSAFLGIQVIRMRVAIRGEEFEVCSLFQRTTRGTASDFIGYREDLHEYRWVLLRRSDLARIEVPQFGVRHAGVDAPIRQWLRTHFAQVSVRMSKAVSRGKALPPSTAHWLLKQTRGEQMGNTHQTRERDLELAQAAYAIAMGRYSAANGELLRILRERPQHGLAQQYVVEALIAQGDTETLPALIESFEDPRCGEVRERLAAAICALAQKQHNALLSAMRKDASLYVRTKAEAARSRLEAERHS